VEPDFYWVKNLLYIYLYDYLFSLFKLYISSTLKVINLPRKTMSKKDLYNNFACFNGTGTDEDNKSGDLIVYKAI
jgi:hypothetical protein